jgi:hypothetical protein
LIFLAESLDFTGIWAFFIWKFAPALSNPPKKKSSKSFYGFTALPN